jgi:trimeric autotransporter adhesin
MEKQLFMRLKKISLYVSMIALLVSVQAPAQQWQYAASYGGSGSGVSDAVNTMCTDASGNVYVAGNFNTSINFGNGTATLVANTTGTLTDAFVAKFNAAGLCQWAISFGGSASDLGGQGIITDGTRVYVTGQLRLPCTIGALGTIASVGGSTDGIVLALNASDGTAVWARAFGGVSALDRGQAICMDNAGRLYISGVFATRNDAPIAYFGANGAFPRTVQGSMSQATTDLFVAQLDAVTGNFNWVSAGGAASQETPTVLADDNITGSGIAFLPVQNELVITGSFSSANAAYYSNGAATPSVSLTNAGQADICLLRMDLSGNFLSGLSAGGPNPDEALAITYDATTSAAYINGYFNSASVSGAFSLTNSAAGFDEVYYARYNPATNTFAWAKNASGSAGGNEASFANAAGASGVYITGRYVNSISFPTATTPLTATSAGTHDAFLLKIDPATGNGIQLAVAGSTTSGVDAGMDVVVSTNHDIWVGGIFAGGTLSFMPSAALSVTTSGNLELFLARYNDPPPVITTHPAPSTACLGLSASFTVVATGALTYQWQESADAGFTTPVTLTNTGIYSNTTTATLTISNNTTVAGRYYRAIVSNTSGSVFSNGALLTATTPSLPSVYTTVSHAATASNHLYYGSSCGLIAKVVPSGASPVAGTVTSEVWVEGAVPTVGSTPFVQRHYQITPAINAGTATGTVTLYFSQAEFNAFNAAAGSVLNLPTGPTDNAGKANLHIDKYSGSSTNGTGLPGSYTSTKMVIDPPDGNIVWNATTSMWEITLDVTGFSGFFIHTSQFVLPDKLLAFAAQLAGTDIKLNWKTSGDANYDHFEVERSTDGISFIKVGSIAAVTGSGNKSYAYTDAGATLLSASNLYYRLKLVSTSGDIDHSRPAIVSLTNPATPVTRIAPNPFRDKLEVGLYLPVDGKLMMKLIDLHGRTVMRENWQAAKGFSTQEMKTRQLLPGVYLLTVEVGGRLYSFKVYKQ